jgi:superkiller protein 3
MKKKLMIVFSGIILLVGVTLVLQWGAVKEFFSRENRSTASVQMALHELSKGNAPEAVRRLEAAVTLNPKNAEAFYYLGKAYQRRGDPPERQIEAYRKVLDLSPNFSEARISLGTAYFGMGKKAEAEQEFQKLLKTDPTNVKANNNLGRMRMEERRFQEAEGFFKKALEVDPEYEFALDNLGNMYFVQGRFKESKVEFERALQLDPKNPGPHYFLAQISEKDNEKDKAIDHWEKALAFGLGKEEAAEAKAHIERLKGKK